MTITCPICQQPITTEDLSRGVIAHKVNPLDELRSCRTEYRSERNAARKLRFMNAEKRTLLRLITRAKLTEPELRFALTEVKRLRKASPEVTQ